MSGAKYLLDTNFILGLVKGQEEVVAKFQELGGETSLYAFSSITRMEALGFPAITDQEESAIAAILEQLTYLPITPDVEDAAIRIRKQRKVKLPDAIIAATSLTRGVELLSLDRDLCNLVQSLTPEEH